MADLSLTVERTIKAAQSDVFNAWLNPEMLQKFMMPGAGMTVPAATNDPKVGGRFEIVMQADGDRMPHAGTYEEIDPHQRIVFTWETPFAEGDSTVTLTFDPVEAGTHVVLTHTRFNDGETRDNHRRGWTSILDTLDITLRSDAGAL